MRKIVFGWGLLGMLLLPGVVFAGAKEFMTADAFLALQASTGQAIIKKGDPAKGHQMYAVFCTPCHGMKGDGQGQLAKLLDPKPRNQPMAKGRGPGME